MFQLRDNEVDLTELSSSFLAAWWGAIISTLLLVWEIFKWWRSGARLRILAVPDMSLHVPSLPANTAGKVILVEVVNAGDQPTTLTNLGILFFPSRWHWYIGWWTRSFAIPTPIGKQLPVELGPGGHWSCSLLQNQELETMMTSGCLTCCIYSVSNPKGLTTRVRRRKERGNC